MGTSKRNADSALNALLALLTEDEQKAVLTYVGENGLHRDDDIFVLISLLKIGAVLVMRVSDSVDAHTYFHDDLQEMLAAHRACLLSDLNGERTALLDRWGDILGLVENVDDLISSHRALISGHREALKTQIRAIETLSRKVDLQIKGLQPLLDLIRPDGSKQAFSPTRIVIDAITDAVSAALEEVLDGQRQQRWRLALKVLYHLSVVGGIATLLYRG